MHLQTHVREMSDDRIALDVALDFRYDVRGLRDTSKYRKQGNRVSDPGEECISQGFTIGQGIHGIAGVNCRSYRGSIAEYQGIDDLMNTISYGGGAYQVFKRKIHHGANA
jgi:hypothetical protein